MPFFIKKQKTGHGLIIGLVVVVGLVLSVFAYGAAQQVYRQGANDPQLQLAQDCAQSLAGGGQVDQCVADVTGTSTPQLPSMRQITDPSHSLRPFVIVTDENHQVLASTFALSGKTVLPPTGVFDMAKQNDQDRLTWQPSDSARIALVVQHYKGGFVLVGRSLSETEQRISQLTVLLVIVLAVIACAGLVAFSFDQKHK